MRLIEFVALVALFYGLSLYEGTVAACWYHLVSIIRSSDMAHYVAEVWYMGIILFAMTYMGALYYFSGKE